MSDSMIEIIAMALNGSSCDLRANDWAERSDSWKDTLRKHARAVIEAMPEEDLVALLRSRKFDSQTTRTSQTECILWTGALGTKDGYGRFYAGDGKTRMAHQFAYEREYGPVPHGLVIDHVCRVRRCVNHLHLRAITNAENVLCGEGITAENAKKCACHKGHIFNTENTYIRPDGNRGCRICLKDANRRYKAKRRYTASAALKE